MKQKMLIDASQREETRVVLLNGSSIEDFDFETSDRKTLIGNIYLARITRVEPSLQAAFVEYGGNRHGFLAFNEIHPDYFKIPTADREALREKQRELVRRQRERQRARDGQEAESPHGPPPEGAAPDGFAGADPHGPEVHEFGDSPNAQAPDAAWHAPGEAYQGPHTGEPSEPHGPEDSGLDPAAGERRVPDIDVDQENLIKLQKSLFRSYKIQEVMKKGQLVVVQVLKDERGNKGAALTTYISLAGRFCVLMPNTATGGGISRKIANASDRKKLRQILSSLEVAEGKGLIIRTAGAKRTKTDIKRDYEYLLQLWDLIRKLALDSIAPVRIYEEANLIRRSIRDLYGKDTGEVLVDGAQGYEAATSFMQMLMPDNVGKIKLHDGPLPLFEKFKVESYLGQIFNPRVSLKSGGYIVIDQTEALVAIDVNSGRATKGSSIEQTALQTNLEAADEIAHQLKLRDLAGLIVIDFIDMDERRNNAAVESRIKERLKRDRSRIQVGKISTFGLLEMSRQRLRPGLVESTTTPCPNCHGTGSIRSDGNLAISILRELRQAAGAARKGTELVVTAPVGIVNYLFNSKREELMGIESLCGVSVRIEASSALTSPEFSIERSKAPSRKPAESAAITADTSLIERHEEPADEAEASKPKKRRPSRKRGQPAEELAAADGAALRPGESAAREGFGHAGAEDGGPEADGDPAPSRGKRRARKRPPRSSESSRDSQWRVDSQEAGTAPGAEFANQPESAPEAPAGAESPSQGHWGAEGAKPRRARRGARRAEAAGESPGGDSAWAAPPESGFGAGGDGQGLWNQESPKSKRPRRGAWQGEATGESAWPSQPQGGFGADRAGQPLWNEEPAKPGGARQGESSSESPWPEQPQGGFGAGEDGQAQPAGEIQHGAQARLAQPGPDESLGPKADDGALEPQAANPEKKPAKRGWWSKLR